MSPSRAAGLILVGLGGGALVSAFILEHGLGLAPCSLCLWERWPYRALVGLGVVCLLVPRAWRALLCCGAFVALLSVGLGLLHLGVEHRWWPNPFPVCQAPKIYGATAAERLASMPLRPVKPCDAPSYLPARVPLSVVELGFVYAVATFGGIVFVLYRRKS